MEEFFHLHDDPSWYEQNAYYSVETASALHSTDDAATIDKHVVLHDPQPSTISHESPPVRQEVQLAEHNRVVRFIEQCKTLSLQDSNPTTTSSIQPWSISDSQNLNHQVARKARRKADSSLYARHSAASNSEDEQRSCVSTSSGLSRTLDFREHNPSENKLTMENLQAHDMIAQSVSRTFQWAALRTTPGGCEMEDGMPADTDNLVERPATPPSTINSGVEDLPSSPISPVAFKSVVCSEAYVLPSVPETYKQQALPEPLSPQFYSSSPREDLFRLMLERGGAFGQPKKNRQQSQSSFSDYTPSAYGESIASNGSNGSSLGSKRSLDTIDSGREEYPRDPKRARRISIPSSHHSSPTNVFRAPRQGRRKQNHGPLPEIERMTLSPEAQDPPHIKESTPQNRNWICHWCKKNFSKGCSYKRHEETFHAPQTEWVCLLNGLDQCGRCALCKEVIMTDNHVNECIYKPQLCLAKAENERRFDRRDNFIKQHLEGTHNLDTRTKGLPLDFDVWERNIHSPRTAPLYDCPFCNAKSMNWTDRYNHISRHYNTETVDMRIPKSCGCTYGYSSLLKPLLERIGQGDLYNKPCRLICLPLNKFEPQEPFEIPNPIHRTPPRWLQQISQPGLKPLEDIHVLLCWSRNLALPMSHLPATFWCGFCNQILSETASPNESYDCVRLRHFDDHAGRQDRGLENVNWNPIGKSKALKLYFTALRDSVRAVPNTKCPKKIGFWAELILTYHADSEPRRDWDLEDVLGIVRGVSSQEVEVLVKGWARPKVPSGWVR